MSTERNLKEWGSRSREALVLWGAHEIREGDYGVVTCYIPKQHRFSDLVEVEEEGMHKVLSQVYLWKQRIVALVHSHPPGVIHPSKIDRVKIPIHFEGFILIVVPNYCSAPFLDLAQCSIYEYRGSMHWRPLGSDEIEERFIIEDYEIEV